MLNEVMASGERRTIRRRDKPGARRETTLAAAICGYLCVQLSPLRVRSRTSPWFEPSMHPEAVIFDFVQPLVAVRRLCHKLRQLRPYPLGQSGARPPLCVPYEGDDASWWPVCASGSIRLASLFLTLPTRALTGQTSSRLTGRARASPSAALDR